MNPHEPQLYASRVMSTQRPSHTSCGGLPHALASRSDRERTRAAFTWLQGPIRGATSQPFVDEVIAVHSIVETEHLTASIDADERKLTQPRGRPGTLHVARAAVLGVVRGFVEYGAGLVRTRRVGRRALVGVAHGHLRRERLPDTDASRPIEAWRIVFRRRLDAGAGVCWCTPSRAIATTDSTENRLRESLFLHSGSAAQEALKVGRRWRKSLELAAGNAGFRQGPRVRRAIGPRGHRSSRRTPFEKREACAVSDA